MSIKKQTNFLLVFHLLLSIVLLPYTTAQGSNDNGGSPPNPATPYGFNTNFNPSMAIIIIVLISAFFFMGFFSIYIRQCAGDRTIRPTTTRIVRQSRRRGLDPTVIEKFPTFNYSVVKGLKIGKGALECAVCLNEFEDDETLRLLPKCDHVFHPECIDAWLNSHVTCPVCRANLTPESAEVNTGNSAEMQVTDSENDSDNENNRTVSNRSEQQVSIAITDDQNCNSTATNSQPDVINPSQIPFQNRPKSMVSRIAGKFPRSHSTGHSLIQPGDNFERFTLRLPDDIRKQIVNGKLNRTTSLVDFPAKYDASGSGSSRRGHRRGSFGEGSSRGKYNRFWRLDSKEKSDRWVFSMQLPFFSRTASVRSPRGDDGEGSVNSKKTLSSITSPFDCLTVKAEGSEQSSTRPPV